MSDFKKYKILMISDIPLFPSGVGSQTKYVIDHLAKTGKFEITVFGGAIKHPNYQPIKIHEWGPDVTVLPVDGYGNKDLLRQAIDIGEIELIWKITDPRFYTWLYEMEDEIHEAGVPISWWTIWDNADEETWPKYNKHYYNACDFLACINKCTYDFLSKNGWADKTVYLPHGVPEEDFKILPVESLPQIKATHLGKENSNAFVVFYNSRNALRKRTGNVIMAFKRFLEMLPKEEQDKCILCMKTPPGDPEGQNLPVLISDLGLKGRVAIADGKFNNDIMNEFYNIADVTVSLSSEEGFGLSVLESLMCGTPVICTRTGGMQDQAIDDRTGEEFGFCLVPEARSLIGGQSTPYIWSDHVKIETAAEKIMEIYKEKKETGKHKERWAGEKARKSALERFNIKTMQTQWEEHLVKLVEKAREKKKEKSKVRIFSL